MEREINLLSDNELNAVVGGRMNLANLGLMSFRLVAYRLATVLRARSRGHHGRNLPGGLHLRGPLVSPERPPQLAASFIAASPKSPCIWRARFLRRRASPHCSTREKVE